MPLTEEGANLLPGNVALVLLLKEFHERRKQPKELFTVEMDDSEAKKKNLDVFSRRPLEYTYGINFPILSVLPESSARVIKMACRLFTVILINSPHSKYHFWSLINPCSVQRTVCSDFQAAGLCDRRQLSWVLEPVNTLEEATREMHCSVFTHRGTCTGENTSVLRTLLLPQVPF